MARLIDDYDLAETGDEFERSWTAVGEQHRSLRDLADEFNRRILRAAMEDAGVRPVKGEVENVYELLTGADESQAERTRIERRLEQQGIDVGRLREDFVSYQAIRSYLVEERGATYEPGREDRLDREAQNIRNLVGRTETVARDKIEQLRSTDRLAIGQFNVLVDVTVVCADCGGRFQIGELFRAESCDCVEAADPPE